MFDDNYLLPVKICEMENACSRSQTTTLAENCTMTLAG